MQNTIMRNTILTFLLLACAAQTLCADFTISNLTNADGLSNSSVNCIFQDRSGLMWMGTWDGLNRYNSRDFEVYKPEIGNTNSICNNIIRTVLEDGDGGLWIATDRGVDRLDRRKGEFKHFFARPGGQPPPVENAYLIAQNNLGRIVLSIYDEGFYSFDPQRQLFEQVAQADTLAVQKMFFDRDDRLWIYTSDHRLRPMDYNKEQNAMMCGDEIRIPPDCGTMENVFYDRARHRLYLPTNAGSVFVYDAYARTFEPEPIRLGDGQDINAMLFAGRVVMWGTDNGLFRHDPADGQTEKILTDVPVLSLCLGSQQMIWVGTDMQGVYTLAPKRDNFMSFTSGNTDGFGKHAVRCFLEMSGGELWVGTKGDGIYVFEHAGDRIAHAVKHRITTRNGLLNNSVYALKEGGIHECWIGTDSEGLNYVDRRQRTVHTLHVPERWRDSIRLASVYSILPDGADTLWVGTSGQGLYRLEIDRKQHPYAIKAYRQYAYDKNKPSSLTNNIIYSIVADGDRHLWIGTRGGGLNRFDKTTGCFTAYRLNGDGAGHVGDDDILCLHKDREGNLWIGTSLGLYQIRLAPDGKITSKLFSRQDGIPNNTIHGILEDGGGNLWVSTNRGLARIIRTGDSHRIVSYFRKDGLQNDEFADGAYYKSPLSDRLYFGGVGGFNTFNPASVTDDRYMPHLLLDAFYIQNTETNLYDCLEMRRGRETLVLDHDMKSVSLRFVPVDYVSGEKCETSYRLDGYHDDWVYLGTSSTIVLSNLPRGKYVLHVRNSNAAKTWGEAAFTLPIIMRPPWWATGWALLAYVTTASLAAFGVQRQVRYRLKARRTLRQKEQEKRHMEEVHQAKLRFFTNIAHEFSNSLTLIYAPCEQLMKFGNNDEIRRHVNTIRANSQRMQSLIQQLVEFRKAETGHLTIRIEPVDINELMRYVLDSFMENVEKKHIHIEVDMPSKPLTWNTDRDSVEKIVFNLLSNAVKYTPQGASIILHTDSEQGDLSIRVKNTGVGIKQANSQAIFDRFQVLERFEMQLAEGFETRSGIGLALCKDLVEVLGGTIEVDSDGDTYTAFIVTLPPKSQETSASTEKTDEPQPRLKPVRLPTEADEEQAPPTPTLSTGVPILVVDDDKEIRTLLRDILSTDFEVMEAANGQEALEAVNLRIPQLVVCDVVMPVMDGIEFTRRMKSENLTKHIPIILLSNQSSVDDQIEGIETGADAYIGKPFHPRHLRALIASLIRNKENVTAYSRSYYADVEAFNNKLVNKESKELLMQIYRVIHENIENENLSAEFIANETALSKMQLYRKVKELTGNTPTELIRSTRLEAASKLLVTTNKTVQEIMFCTGFNNKAYFYREFSKKYQMTPKEYRNRQQA